MRIAFITYEYPPDIAKGGIATYVEQAARLLSARGNNVEVFCGSHSRTVSEKIDGVLIHRFQTSDGFGFQQSFLNKFTERHAHLAFDIVESPEIHADGLLVKQRFPLLPMVVKLHMASFIQIRLLNYYTGALAKFRYFLGGLRRGKINFYGAYHYLNDTEYQFTALADGIVAPSRAQKEIIAKEWHIPAERIAVIAHPFLPPAQLLEIEISAPVKKIVTFVGKLNVHKGIVNLVKIIPLVAKKHPEVVFRLIGSDSFFTVKKMLMSDFIRRELKGYENNYILLDSLEYKEVLKLLETTAVCIFPSLWECFGLVCLEAMSAGRAVIGSSSGGMNDILSEGAGVLTDPLDIKQMAEAVIELLNDEKLRWQYGKTARLKVLCDYNADVISGLMETHYLSTIAKSKTLSSIG